MNDWGEGNSGNQMKKQNGKKKLQEFDRQFKKKMGGGIVFEENGSGFASQGESAISDNFGNYGDRGDLSEHRGVTLMKRC